MNLYKSRELLNLKIIDIRAVESNFCRPYAMLFLIMMICLFSGIMHIDFGYPEVYNPLYYIEF